MTRYKLAKENNDIAIGQQIITPAFMAENGGSFEADPAEVAGLLAAGLIAEVKPSDEHVQAIPPLGAPSAPSRPATIRPESPATPPAKVQPFSRGPARRSVFVSYSHKDGTWLKRLRTVLAPLTRDSKVEGWDDSKIPAGAKWREEIESALAAAKVAVLLVSPDFLESPFIATAEIPPLFKAAREEGVTLLWVHLRPCLWKRTPIADYKAAHDVSRPLAGLSKAKWEAELVRIADEIETALAKA